MKNDQLSDALRRGDPADDQPEAQTMEERKAALLARCMAEPLADPAQLPSARSTPPRKTSWALPALAGAGALTVAALYSAAAWFGASTNAPQTIPAQMVKVSPHPSSTPAPLEMGAQAGKRPSPYAPMPRAGSSGSVAGRTVERKIPVKHRDTSVAVSTPTGRGAKRGVSTIASEQADALSPGSVKAIVRANHRQAEATKSQAALALSKIVEPVVERVIIEQDDTPVEPTPTVTTVAITINGRAESVVVSRAVEPATN